MKYSSALLTYFDNTIHAGSLDLNQADTYRAYTGFAGRDQLEIFVHVDDQKIKAARFLAYGPPELIAGAEYCCRQLEEGSFACLKEFNAQQLTDALGLQAYYIHSAAMICSVLTELFNTIKRSN